MKAQIRIAAATVALVTCLAFEPGYAVSPRVPSVVVSLSGVDFSKDADVKALYQQLRNASRDVCKKVVGPMMNVELGKCASDLLDVAVSQVNRPALTALHGRPVLELSASR